MGNKFQPGQSGNPSGRPRGTTTWTAKLRKQIEARVPVIVERLFELAEAGDTQAARLLLERAVPALKATDQVAAIRLPADGAEAAKALLGALSSGRLSVDQVGSLANTMAALARVKETTELEARIQRLEESAHGQPESSR